MDIIRRNFLSILCAGAFGENKTIEPMSSFKWNKLFYLSDVHHVMGIVSKGLKEHVSETHLNIPQKYFDVIHDRQTQPLFNSYSYKSYEKIFLTSRLLNKRLHTIISNERHSIDTSTETLCLLTLIIDNVNNILNRGISIACIVEMGIFLRTKGDKIDFVKLEDWLTDLQMSSMAQFVGSILIEVFDFESDEIPFVHKVNTSVYWLTVNSIYKITKQADAEWHLRQSEAGFLKNNSPVFKRYINRSFRFIKYAPLETLSVFAKKFTNSLSEIEE